MEKKKKDGKDREGTTRGSTGVCGAPPLRVPRRRRGIAGAPPSLLGGGVVIGAKEEFGIMQYFLLTPRCD
jgi:hypothetical protein